ncbi:MAG: hypothetical protein N3F63_06235 [Thermoplasmata archaeon]|nr:hypothetical protein [Thermoplasmata archaeon]
MELAPIINYISQELQRGTPDNLIKENLLAAGWSEHEINEAMARVRASLPKSEVGASPVAEVAVTTRTVISIASLIKGVVVTGIFIIFGIILILSGYPYFFLGIVLIFIGSVVLIATAISCLRQPKVEERYTPAQQVFTGPQVEERVMGVVPGVLRYVQKRRHRGWGEYPPENAMIFTNQRVILVVVPVSSGNSGSLQEMLLPSWHWLTKVNEIRSELEHMIRTMSVNEILWQDARNFWFSYTTIKKIDVGRLSMNIQIVLRDGRKFVYSVREKADLERAREIVEKLSSEFR